MSEVRNSRGETAGQCAERLTRRPSGGLRSERVRRRNATSAAEIAIINRDLGNAVMSAFYESVANDIRRLLGEQRPSGADQEKPE